MFNLNRKYSLFKESLRHIVRDRREYLKYLKYKNTLPKNLMHDDIFIVEFPKSGITWLSYILGNIELQLMGKDDFVTFYNHHKYVIDVHQTRNSEVNRIMSRTFIKSHSVYNPYYYFVLYLIRNPFDVMVSYYNFMYDHGYHKSFENFVKDERYGIEKWKEHISSWFYQKTDAQRMHFIKYENLIKDPAFEITCIYQNLGLKLDKDILNKALDLSNIEHMSLSEKHYRENNPNYKMSFVGKENKQKKNELLNDKIKEYIYLIAGEEIREFYPELLNEKK